MDEYMKLILKALDALDDLEQRQQQKLPITCPLCLEGLIFWENEGNRWKCEKCSCVFSAGFPYERALRSAHRK